MILTPHALSGAAIAITVPEPLVGLPLALGSHYLLDMVPHWQETLPPYTPHRGTAVRTAIDSALSVALLRLIARSHPERARWVWLTAGAAILPDADSVVRHLPGSLKRSTAVLAYCRWHINIQRETASFWGLLPQIAVSLLCLLRSRPVRSG